MSAIGTKRDKALDTAQADLRGLIRREKDRLRLAELKNAERNLREAKSRKDDPSSSDFLMAMALKVIESHLPKTSTEKRRFYLTEAIERFTFAGSTSDAAVLESRLKTLPAPVEAPKQPDEPEMPAPSHEEKPVPPPPPSEPATPEKRENRFSTLLKSGTVDDWLGSIGQAQDEAERVELGSTLSLITRDLAASGYRSFLIACFESKADRDSLLSLVERADKPTKRFVEILCDLKDRGEVECLINDSLRDYVTKLLETLAGLKDGEGPRGRWEFQLSNGTTITVVSNVKKDPETGRAESYVFKKEPVPTV